MPRQQRQDLGTVAASNRSQNDIGKHLGPYGIVLKMALILVSLLLFRLWYGSLYSCARCWVSNLGRLARVFRASRSFLVVVSQWLEGAGVFCDLVIRCLWLSRCRIVWKMFEDSGKKDLEQDLPEPQQYLLGCC